MVERFNRTLEAMLSTVVEEDQSDWDEQILFMLAAYRASSHAVTGFSPNFLMMGREVILPVEVMYGRTPGLMKENQRGEAAYAADVRERLREAHRLANCLHGDHWPCYCWEKDSNSLVLYLKIQF